MERNVRGGIEIEQTQESIGAQTVRNVSNRTASLVPATKARVYSSERDVPKRLFDLIFAVLAGTIFAPIILVLCIVIRISGSPILFGQVRIGQNGEKFNCYKFRTMVVDAEERLAELLAADSVAREQWNDGHKIVNDPRVTKFGRYLRKSSLDELPQLLNVFLGQMSIVGPRPIVEDEIFRYGEDFGAYISVKPGITGLWQVNGRSDTTYRERVLMDRYYARSHSLWRDIGIILRTIRVVLGRVGAY